LASITAEQIQCKETQAKRVPVPITRSLAVIEDYQGFHAFMNCSRQQTRKRHRLVHQHEIWKPTCPRHVMGTAVILQVASQCDTVSVLECWTR
jgi:hypothetical protein